MHVTVLRTRNNRPRKLAPKYCKLCKCFWVLENTVTWTEQESRGKSPTLSRRKGVQWPEYAITSRHSSFSTLSMELFLEKPTLCGKQSSWAVRCNMGISSAEESYWSIRYAQEPCIPITLSKSKKYIAVAEKETFQEQVLNPSKHCVKYSIIRSQSLIGRYKIIFYTVAKNSFNLCGVP